MKRFADDFFRSGANSIQHAAVCFAEFPIKNRSRNRSALRNDIRGIGTSTVGLQQRVNCFSTDRNYRRPIFGPTLRKLPAFAATFRFIAYQAETILPHFDSKINSFLPKICVNFIPFSNNFFVQLRQTFCSKKWHRNKITPNADLFTVCSYL